MNKAPFLIMLAIALFSCGVHNACPEIKAAKLKKSSYHKFSFKRRVPSPSSITNVRLNKNHYREIPTATKTPQDVEEWDCPRPGQQKNDKIVKENRRRLEKQARINFKKSGEASNKLIPR